MVVNTSFQLQMQGRSECTNIRARNFPLLLLHGQGLPDQELITTVKKDYKVTGRIMIQDGQHSHIRRFKSEMEHDGIIDPGFELKVLNEFAADIKAEASQTTLAVSSGDTPEKKDAKKK